MEHVHAFSADALGESDATDLAARITAGDISAREAVDASIARAHTVNPHLNGIVLNTFDAARQDAARERSGVFAGVPTFVKDNTDVAGLPTNQGSLAVNGRPAAAHSPFTDQFLSTGMTVLGKTTMPEFGFNATTEYENLPPTRNPWNTDYSCGASSGGSAVMVASGVVPIAHANDGGGSIRIPAAACGLVGLKPTRGRVADAPEAASMPINIISNGVLTRTVRDTARFYAGIERHQRSSTLPPMGEVTGPSGRRLKIGFLVDSVTDQATDDETRDALFATVKHLEALGHTVNPIDSPVDQRFIKDFLLYWSLLAFSTQHFGKHVMGPRFDKRHTDPLTQGLARKFRHGLHRLPRALYALKHTERVYREFFADTDLVLSPVLAHTTPKLGYLSPDVEFDTLIERLVNYVSFTPLNNAAGGPAISLPLCSSGQGMPIGMQFSAVHGDERTLLELAYELEAAHPFARIQT